MKNRIWILVVVLGLTIALYFPCKSMWTKGEAVFPRFMKRLNHILPGCPLKVAPGKWSVSKINDSLYRVELRDVKFNCDFVDILKFIISQSFAKPGDLDEFETLCAHVGEIVALYEPQDSKIKILYCKNINVHIDMGKTSFRAGLQFKSVDARVACLDLFNVDVDRLIREGQKIPPTNQSSIERFQIEIQGVTHKAETFTILMEIRENVNFLFGRDNFLKGTYLLKKDVRVPDFAYLLARGVVLTNLHVQVQDFHLSILKNRRPWAHGRLGKAFFSCNMGPDESRNFFKFALQIGLENFKSSFPNWKSMEKLCNLNYVLLSLEWQRLGPEVLAALYELITKGIHSRDRLNPNFTEILVHSMNLVEEGIKSKVKAVLSLDIDHAFGKGMFEADYRPTGLFSMPGIQAQATFLYVDSLLKNIKKSRVFKEDILEKITRTLTTCTKAEGHARMTWEVSPQNHGVILVNGKPRPLTRMSLWQR